MDNFEEKELRKVRDALIKEETFDEFLIRAYNQLTPEEQTKFRQKS